jgi:hypothetical protein
VSDDGNAEQLKFGISQRGLPVAEAYPQEAQSEAILYQQGGGSSSMTNEIRLANVINAVLLPKFEDGEVATPADARLIKSLISQIEEVTKAKWAKGAISDVNAPEHFDGMAIFEDDPLDDETLLRRALDPTKYTYYDYYREPPLVYDSGTSGGSLRLGITERMVTKRSLRVRRLIRKHGARQGWSEERITTAISEGTAVMLDRDDPRLRQYPNL